MLSIHLRSIFISFSSLAITIILLPTYLSSLLITCPYNLISCTNNPEHLLHHKVIAADAVCSQRLVSHHPFSKHAARLSNVNYDPAKAWSDRFESGPPLIRTACPQPRPVLPPEADLLCKQWVKLNRLRCGTARVGDTLKLWGAQESATCACGHTTQSVQHVVIDCMIHKAPDGFAGLRRPDAATRSWLKDLNFEI